MKSELLNGLACNAFFGPVGWFVYFLRNFYKSWKLERGTASAKMRLPSTRSVYVKKTYAARGTRAQCARAESDQAEGRTRDGLRGRIRSRTVILPILNPFTFKEQHVPEYLIENMSRVPLIPAERGSTEQDSFNMVMLEAGLPGDTWRYCVERERLAERSEWFRAMLVGPLAPAPSDPPPLLKLQHVEKRAFDHLLRYLHDEPVNFQSVSTARSTLDAAHQYLCPELARLAVEYLERNLNPGTVLEIYQGLGLYANHPCVFSRSPTSPTAPPSPTDDAGQIAAVCTRLYRACMEVIDTDPESVFCQERFEELSQQEAAELAVRDTLRLRVESVLFCALDRWAASECRRRGLEPSGGNKRTVLEDEVWYSVRYCLMTDREFIEGPMASGVLTSEESAYIVARILGHPWNHAGDELQGSLASPQSRLSSIPRVGTRTPEEQSCGLSKPGRKEQQDNRKNRRKECATQGQRTCARIGNCLVRVLACVFD